MDVTQKVRLGPESFGSMSSVVGFLLVLHELFVVEVCITSSFSEFPWFLKSA